MLLPKFFSQALKSRFNPFSCPKNQLSNRKHQSFGICIASSKLLCTYSFDPLKIGSNEKQNYGKKLTIRETIPSTKQFWPLQQQILHQGDLNIGTQCKPIPDLEQIITLSPAFKNSLASAYPNPEFFIGKKETGQ